MENNNTTAVLSPISEQAEETKVSSQPVNALSSQDGQQKAAEKKRSARPSENKRMKIFCGSSNKALAEEICKFVGVPLGETRLQRRSEDTRLNSSH